MKLLIISHKFYPDIGGIETHTETLAQNFLEMGHEVNVLTWSLGESDKFNYNIIRNPSFSDQLRILKWSDCVIENNPSLRLSWPLIFLRKKHIVIIQTWLNKDHSRFSYPALLKKQWLNQANRVIAISKVIKEVVFPNATIVPNAYNVIDFYNLNNDRNKDFVFLGRLVSDKGADMTLELVNYLTKKYNRTFDLTIIGSGPEEDNLKELVSRNDLMEQVIFTGNLKGHKLNQELNKHKFLVIPSKWREPFGIVALEGIASGCIPIVSDDSGLVDAVGNAGIIFKRNDVDSLCKEVDQMIENSNELNRLLKNGREHIKNFTGREIALKTLKIIEDI